jgi:hypothetical protein
MRHGKGRIAVLAGALAAGCVERPHDPAPGDLLLARVERMEKRLGLAEKRCESMPELRKDVRAVEDQLAAVQARVAQLAGLPSPSSVETPRGGTGVAAAEPLSARSSLDDPDVAPRRSAVAALGEEYGAAVAELKKRYGDDPGSAQLQDAMAELQQSYGERLHALVGEERQAGHGD